METLRLPVEYKRLLQNFKDSLKDIYQTSLVSVIVYGSAASGEYINKQSNLNILIVLADMDLENITKSSNLLRRFKIIDPLFMSTFYIKESAAIFPIEFLDMRENHYVIYGNDVLKDVCIDIRNLRFQCEQELRQKFIKMQRVYLRAGNNAFVLRDYLISFFTSTMHVVRNLLILKGLRPPYLKQELLRSLAVQFKINTDLWNMILRAKNCRRILKVNELKELYAGFMKDIGLIVNAIDSF